MQTVISIRNAGYKDLVDILWYKLTEAIVLRIPANNIEEETKHLNSQKVTVHMS